MPNTGVEKLCLSKLKFLAKKTANKEIIFKAFCNIFFN